MKLLQGKKTYLVGAILGALSFLSHIDIVTQDMHQNILGFLMAIGLTTLRSGMEKK